MSSAFVIAIDGPAASGKGTLARRLAEHFGLFYLDSGALYRATARDLLRAGGSLEDEVAAARAAADIDPESLGDPGLRGEAMGHGASKVASLPAVRAALLGFQRRIAATPPGAVIDGRDIGTVVCPNAQAKLYLTADQRTRAHRRWLEMSARGGPGPDQEAVLRDLALRDQRDAERDAAPMRPAEDALPLDTSGLTVEAMIAAAIALVDQKYRAGATR